MTRRFTPEELSASLARCDAALDRTLKGRAVNLSFARRKGLYLRVPDFCEQLVGPENQQPQKGSTP